MTYDASEMK